MDHPLCKICKTRHRLGPCPSKETKRAGWTPSNRAAPEKSAYSPAGPDLRDQRIAELEAEVARLMALVKSQGHVEKKAAAKRDRAEYMRSYRARKAPILSEEESPWPPGSAKIEP